MCRPRDSHDLRLIDTGISISPPATQRWVHDVFGNSVLVASFAAPASELVFESSFVAEHYPADPDVELIEPYAETLPFSYDASEVPDLARVIERRARFLEPVEATFPAITSPAVITTELQGGRSVPSTIRRKTGRAKANRAHKFARGDVISRQVPRDLGCRRPATTSALGAEM